MRLLALLIPCLFCCALAAQAEIDVLRNAVSIPDGGADSINNTGTSPFNLSYTIRNDGSVDLNLTAMPEVAISGETNCSVTLLVAPVSPVAQGGGTTSFTLQVTPAAATAFSFDISIASDDADENPYDFSFTGFPFVASAPAGGGGGGDSGNCSSSDIPGWGFLTLAGALALACAALRVGLRRD